MRRYISGPITGHEQTAHDRFKAAEDWLEHLGHETINPWIVSESMIPHINLDNDEWLTLDKAMISVCDAIYLLRGWDESDGCGIERKYADELGLMIMEEDDCHDD